MAVCPQRRRQETIIQHSVLMRVSGEATIHYVLRGAVLEPDVTKQFFMSGHDLTNVVAGVTLLEVTV